MTERFNHNKLYLIDGRTLERIVETVALLVKENKAYDKPMEALLKILLTLEEIYDIDELSDFDDFDDFEAKKIFDGIFNNNGGIMPLEEDDGGVDFKQLLKNSGVFIPSGRK